ncbi:hypothetical protein [Arenivirga flava]|uniref:Uncharacterized protein n=1 Tax=Arenivirga flava TaxID=1930060 RepID=A0AA37UDQ6_9MICO|nr:hypothetical protein [Arenivirga flava]GMA28713.1 hypothetical protein GCM10025874_19660 [Arenivirga flava]
MTHLPTIQNMGRDAALEAHSVSVFALAAGPQAGCTVIEIINAHQHVIARTVTDRDGTREALADAVLEHSALERCASFSIVPAKRHKRIAALVALRASSTGTTLGALRTRSGLEHSA